MDVFWVPGQASVQLLLCAPMKPCSVPHSSEHLPHRRRQTSPGAILQAVIGGVTGTSVGNVEQCCPLDEGVDT